MKESQGERFEMIDWLKAWAILAVVLDHLKFAPEPAVVWSVNIFVLVTAAVYSIPGYIFTFKKLLVKLLYLAFLYAFAIVFVDAILDILHERMNRALFSLFLHPRYIFIKNPYLGDIWYLSLHIQILCLFYLFLKYRDRLQAKYVVLIAGLVTPVSFFLTHFVLKRYFTIPVTSWFLFLTAGFYGMRPLLEWIRVRDHSRPLWVFAALAVLLANYAAWYQLAPGLFTNANRSSFLTLPFYFGLIFFLTEVFYLVGRSVPGLAVRNAMGFLGKYTLAIYLTHQVFACLWGKVSNSPLLVFPLTVSSGLLFGILADRAFMLLNFLLQQPRQAWAAGCVRIFRGNEGAVTFFKKGGAYAKSKKSSRDVDPCHDPKRGGEGRR